MELTFFSRLIRVDYAEVDSDAVSALIDAELTPHLIASQREQTAEAIIVKAGSIQQDESLALYIRGLQLRLVAFSDRLWHQSRDTRTRSKVPYSKAQNESLQAALLQLQYMLEEYFPRYINREGKVSCYRQTFCEKQLRALDRTIETVIKADASVSEVLQIVQAEVGQALQQNRCKQEMCLNELTYWEQLGEALATLFQLTDPDRNEHICALLRDCNFNSRAFIRYIISQKKNQLLASEDIGEKRAVVFGVLEDSILSETDVALNPGQASVGESLRHCAANMLRLLEDERSSGSDNPQANGSPDEVKLQAGVSVSQLACFLRLMSTCGVISNKNHSELVRFFAQNCRSQRGEEISADSLRAKYYTIERSTSDAVRNLLLDMVNQSRRGMPW
jgi:hypothetical protein